MSYAIVDTITTARETVHVFRFACNHRDGCARTKTIREYDVEHAVPYLRMGGWAASLTGDPSYCPDHAKVPAS